MKTIDYDSTKQHVTCNRCHKIVEFTNDEIYVDEFGMEVTCPNCGNDICF